MKTIFLCTVLLISFISFSQTKLITKTGKIFFEASVPSFEPVEAKNEAVTCILNAETGEIASLALMKGFRFKVALMEEHFNENYIESDTYPKATFSGKIDNFDFSKLSTTAKDYTIKGKVEMHGKSKDIAVTAHIKKGNDGVDIDSDFVLYYEDFDIKFSDILSKKVSKKVNVKIDFTLK